MVNGNVILQGANDIPEARPWYLYNKSRRSNVLCLSLSSPVKRYAKASDFRASHKVAVRSTLGLSRQDLTFSIVHTMSAKPVRL